MSVEYAREAPNPALSVVIPTIPAYDHASTVSQLRQQNFEDEYEVILVNDSELDRSAARNVGLRTAKADVVGLTDDDCLPPPTWLSRIDHAFRDDPELVCLEGAVYGGSRYDGIRHYVGCNLAVRKKPALEVGGFRSEYAAWREDTEFGWRMERDAPGHCTYDGGMRMCHPTIPRTRFDRGNERKLKAEYPKRYATILDASMTRRLYRRARAAGLTEPIHRLRNRLFGSSNEDMI